MNILTDSCIESEMRKAERGKITDYGNNKLLAGTSTWYPGVWKEYIHRIIANELANENYLHKMKEWYPLDKPTDIDEAWDLYDNTLNSRDGMKRIGVVSHESYPRAVCRIDIIAEKKYLATFRKPAAAKDHVALMTGYLHKDEGMLQQYRMWVTGMETSDFVSYDRRFPAKHRLYVHTIERDDEMMVRFEDEIPKFIEELETVLEAIGG